MLGINLAALFAEFTAKNDLWLGLFGKFKQIFAELYPTHHPSPCSPVKGHL